MDHNSPEEIVIGLTSSGISVQAQCHRAKVVIIPLLPRDRKLSLRRGNINIIDLLLESECPKHNLYTYNHELKWLNADGSLKESLFYSDNFNELLAKEIVAFCKSFKSNNYHTASS